MGGAPHLQGVLPDGDQLSAISFRREFDLLARHR